MRLDMVITFGNVLQMGLTLLAVVAAYYGLRERMIAIETRLAPLWQEYTDRRTTVRRAEDRD